jgi:hypothetical protein
LAGPDAEPDLEPDAEEESDPGVNLVSAPDSEAESGEAVAEKQITAPEKNSKSR